MVIPQIEPEKFIKHSIHEIYVGKSKDTLDCVGVHSLGVKEVTGMMDTVFTRNLDCNEPIERLYYSAKFADICVHCSSESVSPWNDTKEFYPQCESCSEKTKIPNVKAQRKK